MNVSNIELYKDNSDKMIEDKMYDSYQDNGSYLNYSDYDESAVRDEMFEYVTEGILLTSISILGLIGNIMAMYVLLRPSLRGIFSNILTGLASFDALFLATMPFTFGLPILSPYYKEHMFVHIMPISYGLTLTFRLGSVLATLSVTLERFFAIVFPLKNVRRLKKWLIPGSVIITVIYNFPTFFEITTAIDPENNSTYIITGTPLRQNFIYFSVYKVYCKLALDLIAYVVMLVLNSFIITKIVHSSNFRKKITKNEGEATNNDSEPFIKAKSIIRRSTAKSLKEDDMARNDIKTKRELEEQRQEHKLGTLLVSISFLFICCQSFKMIPDIYELIKCPPVDGQPQACETTPFISTCVSLSHLLVCCNSALNWIVYLLAGEKFRRVWCEVYLPMKCRPKPLGRSQTQATRFTATTKLGKKSDMHEGCRNLNGESRTNEAHEMTSKNKSVGTPPKDTVINARSNGPH